MHLLTHTNVHTNIIISIHRYIQKQIYTYSKQNNKYPYKNKQIYICISEHDHDHDKRKTFNRKKKKKDKKEVKEGLRTSLLWYNSNQAVEYGLICATRK